MQFWLAKGIDGFRMDVINMISKVSGLPDALITSNDRYQFGDENFINGPRLLEFLDEMKQKVLSKYDILTVGETPSVSPQNAIDLTDEDTGALSMVFQFQHMHFGLRFRGRFGAAERQAAASPRLEAGHNQLAARPAEPRLE